MWIKTCFSFKSITKHVFVRFCSKSLGVNKDDKRTEFAFCTQRIDHLDRSDKLWYQIVQWPKKKKNNNCYTEQAVQIMYVFSNIEADYYIFYIEMTFVIFIVFCSLLRISRIVNTYYTWIINNNTSLSRSKISYICVLKTKNMF